MYQQRPTDLASLFMKAQQIKNAESQNRLREQQMRDAESQNRLRELQMRDMEQKIDAQDRKRIEYIKQKQREQQIMDLRERASRPEITINRNNMMQQRAQQFGVPEEVAINDVSFNNEINQNINKQIQESPMMARQKLAQIAPKDPWLKARETSMRKDFSPALVEASNAFGYTPEEGLKNKYVQQFLRSAAQDKARGKSQFEIASGLRREFQGLKTIQNTELVAESLAKINNTSATGAGDLSLIFAYMKLLDPGSVVREREFANAQNTGSAYEKGWSLYNRILSGQRLAPSQRAMFKNEAKKLFSGQLSRYNSISNQYKKLASKNKLDPTDIVLNTGLINLASREVGLTQQPVENQETNMDAISDDISDDELRKIAESGQQ
jgi:hypothetical protein